MMRSILFLVYLLTIFVMLTTSQTESSPSEDQMDMLEDMMEDLINLDTDSDVNHSENAIELEETILDSSETDVDGDSVVSSSDETSAYDEIETTESAYIYGTNPWVDMFGDTLYRWEMLPKTNEQEIVAEKTSDLLAGKKTIGIYFSASWCGPCKQFTPALAQFYNEMNKKGKKFEIVWVSRDQTTDDFIKYYQHMPWLAVPVEVIEKVAQVLATKYKMKGIPHLVILDGNDASVYTLDGRTMVAKDKYGLEFPWVPRTLFNALPAPVKRYIKNQIDTIKIKMRNTLKGVLSGFLPPVIMAKILQ